MCEQPNPSKHVLLSCETEYCELEHGETEMMVLAHIQAPKLTEESVEKGDRVPVTVSAVIDKSGSMSGQKLDLVKETMKFVVENLNHYDRLGVVSYDDNVNEAAQLRPMTDDNKEYANQQVTAIQPGSSTNLSGGLFGGLSQLQGEEIDRCLGTRYGMFMSRTTPVTTFPVQFSYSLSGNNLLVSLAPDHNQTPSCGDWGVPLSECTTAVTFTMENSSAMVAYDKGSDSWTHTFDVQQVKAAGKKQPIVKSSSSFAKITPVKKKMSASKKKKSKTPPAKRSVKPSLSVKPLVAGKPPASTKQKLDDLCAEPSFEADELDQEWKLVAQVDVEQIQPGRNYIEAAVSLVDSSEAANFSKMSSVQVPESKLKEIKTRKRETKKPNKQDKQSILPLIKLFMLSYRREFGEEIGFPNDLLMELCGFLRDSTISSVWLFTDGQANSGITQPKELKRELEKRLAKASNPCSVFTFGFGADHDENMMQSLSEAANGMYYFIETVDTIGEAFTDCLGGLMSVTSQDIQLLLLPANGSTVTEVLCNYPTTRKNNSIEVQMSDLYAEEGRDILFRVKVPAVETDSDEFPLGCVKLAYFNALTNSYENCIVDIVVNRRATPVPNQVPPLSLDKQRNRLKVADAIESATRLAEQNKMQEARDLLQQTDTVIGSSASAAEDYTKDLQKDLEQCKNEMRDQNYYYSVGSKAMKSIQATHSKQRSTGIGASSEAYSNCVKTAMKKKYAASKKKIAEED